MAFTERTYHSARALSPRLSGHKSFSASAATYFRPRPVEFSGVGIQPSLSEWASGEDPVPNLFSLAERENLRVRARTVVFHNSPLATANPDAAITNCFGDVFAHALCLSTPKAQEHGVSLVRAISKQPIHGIELEAAGFYGYDHLSHHDMLDIIFDLLHLFLYSCCLFAYCRLRFHSAGLDADFISKVFRSYLMRFFDGKSLPTNSVEKATTQLDELLGEKVAAALLQVRNECLLELLEKLRTIVPNSMELTICSGLSPFEGNAQIGIYPEVALKVADRLLLVVFNQSDTAFQKRFDEALKRCPDTSRWIAGTRIFPPDTKSGDAIERRLNFLDRKGFSAIHLYHYGVASRHLREAAAQAWQRVKGALP